MTETFDYETREEQNVNRVNGEKLLELIKNSPILVYPDESLDMAITSQE